jgi:Flp pilus assembly protein TadD
MRPGVTEVLDERIFGVRAIDGSGDASTPLLTLLQNALTEHGEGHFTKAIGLYQRVLALQPEQADALHYLGVALAQAGRFQESLVPLELALKLQPDHFAAHNHHGNALAGLSRHDAALLSYDRSIQLRKDFADAHYNRGSALVALNRLEEALDSFDRAITLKPDYAQAYHNRANVFQRLGRYPEALASCQQALQYQPGDAESHVSLGVAFASLGRLDEAMESYRRALRIEPALDNGQWNKALVHLVRGEFEQGWPLYEARWRVKNLGYHNRFAHQPLWLGVESLQGKTILLHTEQGFGDAIQFCRYAVLAATQGAKVILAVPSPMHALMTSLAGVDQVISRGDVPAFDLQCPLLSLPLAFGTSVESIPAPRSYLRAPGTRQAHWVSRLGFLGKPRIGVAWSGRESHVNDKNRSIALEQFLPLLRNRATFVSLQKVIRAVDEQLLARIPSLARLGEQLTDFADTAALISELDLVITVDTAVAHLAGALGKPVWILLPCVADWRWLQDREDSPWYPSARLFRQPTPSDWGSVIKRLREELRSWVNR